MMTYIVNWQKLGSWVVLADKPGEEIHLLLRTTEAELRAALQIVNVAIDTASIREFRESMVKATAE